MSEGAAAPAYRAAVEALQARGRFGIRLGLGRTRALLHALGDPHVGLPGALIAGTNGKGSVQAIVAAVLRAHGHRVGQTPSPHLVTYRERITVDGQPIAAGDFAELIREVLAAETGIAGRLGHATEFELLTAAAFAWFRRAGVGLGVIEVGMGGRLDATNAWDGGVAAVTNVDLDHTDRLGTTVEAIAREKAAIIKPSDRAVTAATGVALDVIRARAGKVGAPLREVAALPVRGMDLDGLAIAHPRFGELRLSLLGRHQAANAAVALAIVEELEALELVRLDRAAVAQGLSEVRWPGRLERLERAGSTILLDGAHNPAGVAALVVALDELFGTAGAGPLAGRPVVLVGFLADKDIAGMVDPLVRSAALERARIITTRVPGARGASAESLATAWRDHAAFAASGQEVRAIDQVEDGLATGLAAAAEARGPLLVVGSLYLVGDVRSMLVDDSDLRDP